MPPEQLFEPIDCLLDGFAVTDLDPDTHECASCTADALPVESATCR